MTTGTIMFAAAVLEVVSESSTAASTEATRSPKLPSQRQQAGDAAPHRLGEAGLKREHAEREAAAVEQDDSPIDAAPPHPR